MADIGSLNVNISTSGVSAFAASLNRMRAAANKSNLGKVADETKAVGAAADHAAKRTSKFGASLIRIFKYRLIRSTIKNIGRAFKEGVGNLYEYSAALNSADSAANKATMDSYASSLLYLKNAAGAAAGPLLQALLPVVQQLVEWFVAGANAVNQFISALQGKTTFTKAVYNMTEFGDQTQRAAGAAKELKKTVLGFDELNLLQVDNGRGSGGGASTPDYSKMFEEAEIDSTISKIADTLRPFIDYLTENFSTILTIVGAIGLGMLAWRIGSGIAGLFGKLGSAVGSSGAGKTLSVTNTLKGLADIALIVGGLTAIVVAYGELRKIPGFDDVVADGLEGLKTLFEGLSEIALPLAGFATGILALGKIGIATVTKGIVGFAEIIAGLGVVVLAIGELRKIDGFDDVIASGSEMLADFGTTIGEFVGNLVGGFSEGITSGLPGIGTNLSGFMTNSKPFFDGMAKIDQTTVESALALAGVIVSLTGASILDGLTSWLTGGVDFEKFGKQLPALGSGIKAFSDSVKGVSSQNVKAAANAALVLAELQDNLPRSGGWAQKIAGEKNLTTFASALPKLGKALKEFSLSAEGVSAETVTEATSAGKAIAELQSNLPRTGGWAQAIAGEKNLTGFANALPTLGSALKSFSNSIGTSFNSDAVSAAGNSAKSLAAFYNNLPREGGVVAKLAGERNLKDFVTVMPTIGTAIKNFATNLGTIEYSSVTSASNAALTIAKMYSNLPKQGGLAELVAGKSDLSDFAKALPGVGTSIHKYAENIGTIDTVAVTASANAATSIAKFAKTIPNDGGLVGLITGDNDISTFAKGLVKFGSSFKSYAENIGDIDKDKVTTSTNAAKAVAEFAKIIPNSGGLLSWFTGDNDLADFGKSLSKFGGSFKTYADTVGGIKNIETVNKITKAISEVANLAVNIKNAGAENVLTDFGTSVKNLGSSMQDYFKNSGFNYDSGKSLGKTFGGGIAEGVKYAVTHYTYPRLDVKVSNQNGTSSAQITAVDPNEELRLKTMYGYASGGFPDADLFMANENGVPELVGRIGSQTAVANQDQIVQAVSQGVFEAVMAANSGTRSSGSNDIHVTLKLGEYELSNAVVSAMNNQTRRIGYSQLEGV